MTLANFSEEITFGRAEWKVRIYVADPKKLGCRLCCCYSHSRSIFFGHVA